MSKILALDFDGVIVDSIDECFERTVEAYAAICGPFLVSLAFKNFFYKYRYLVGPASHFVFLVDAIKSHLDTKENNHSVIQVFNQLVVDEIGKESNRKKDFEGSFFLSRKNVRSLDEAAWLAKHKIYKQILPFIADYCPNSIYIATMKDSDSVQLLLKYFSIDIPSQNIMGTELGPNKKVHIKKILKTTGVRPADIKFIDDNVGHLIEVIDCGINLAFASWGYGDAKSIENLNPTNIEILE